MRGKMNLETRERKRKEEREIRERK